MQSFSLFRIKCFVRGVASLAEGPIGIYSAEDRHFPRHNIGRTGEINYFAQSFAISPPRTPP